MPSDREKAILAGFRSNKAVSGDFDDPYIELAQLADTSGALVAATILQRDANPTPQFFIGPGKVREIEE
ncbi:MAG TPA: GTPase HflX, partial [bacterium]|nr:GTPase HflX [bacterium]